MYRADTENTNQKNGCNSGVRALLKLEAAYPFLLFGTISLGAAIAISLFGVILAQIAEDRFAFGLKPGAKTRHMLLWGLGNIAAAIVILSVILWKPGLGGDWPKLSAIALFLSLYAGAILGGRLIGIIVDTVLCSASRNRP